ncbi:MAG: hypothetical protein HOM68_07250 [Gemmatimonadetes bacterium]|jgi:hypothetical protein|nr:hypothetical protein [Gemmatimonadota bacterium]MBT5056319.1 hypothetical protein [Gemmatimonadota bacterium]MBT5145089.1 hypothetical protein [Gemmatimonadota bacterium]MBT5586903.1 hypothetical protein [Gemmatimonadota bacterium]MBT5965434.1 hypothetical protein [Gemmatimonadota bacterium]
MFEDLYRDAQRLLQSQYLSYALAGIFIVIWLIASRIVGIVRHASGTREERPRRRLPLN